MSAAPNDRRLSRRCKRRPPWAMIAAPGRHLDWPPAAPLVPSRPAPPRFTGRGPTYDSSSRVGAPGRLDGRRTLAPPPGAAALPASTEQHLGVRRLVLFGRRACRLERSGRATERRGPLPCLRHGGWRPPGHRRFDSVGVGRHGETTVPTAGLAADCQIAPGQSSGARPYMTRSSRCNQPMDGAGSAPRAVAASISGRRVGVGRSELTS